MAPPKRPWFRFYVEAMRDPKLRMLTPPHRWLFVAVLGCARQSPVPGVLLVTESVPMTPELIADEAGLSVSETRKGLKALANLELIEWDDDAWVVTKWNERQFESDETTQRTRKHRSKNGQRNVPSSDDVAPPETESEKEKSPQSPKGLEAIPKLPRTQVRKIACPNCGAAAGQKCWGVDKAYRRESNHQERVIAAASTMDPTRLRHEARQRIEDCDECGGRGHIDLDDNTVAPCPACRVAVAT